MEADGQRERVCFTNKGREVFLSASTTVPAN